MGIIRLNFFCFLLCGVILSPRLADSFPYQPAENIQIMSESATDFSESRKPNVYTWRVVPEASQSGGTITLSFFKEMSDIRLCKLVLSESGTILDVEITDVSRNMMIREDDLLIISGFQLPCDILPFRLMTGDHPSVSKVYHVKRSTSTQTFMDTLEVQTYPVTYESAQANGWIKNVQNSKTTGLLQVLKVVNQRTSEVLSLQLWTADSDWWIYEKTMFRQSWRLP